MSGRRVRLAVIVLAVLAVGALTMAVVRFQATRATDRLADEAGRRERRQQEAERSATDRRRRADASKQLAARAATALPRDRELSMLLSLEALAIDGTREAEDALRRTLLEEAAPTLSLVGHSGVVHGAEFSADGKRILSRGADGTVRLWDAETGASLRTLRTAKGPTPRCAPYAFSPDGQRLATASTDQTARIWDTATGRCLRVLAAHEELVSGVDWSPSGRWIATAGRDGRIQIWDAATGDSLIAFLADTPLTSVAFSPDGKRIVTGTTDGRVLVHGCGVCGTIEDLRALAREHVHRQLTAWERREYVPETLAVKKAVGEIH